jgi:hypothetical protein
MAGFVKFTPISIIIRRAGIKKAGRNAGLLAEWEDIRFYYRLG